MCCAFVHEKVYLTLGSPDGLHSHPLSLFPPLFVCVVQVASVVLQVSAQLQERCTVASPQQLIHQFFEGEIHTRNTVRALRAHSNIHFTLRGLIGGGGGTEQIIELHYQKLGVVLHANLALCNILAWGEGVFVFITADTLQTLF